MSQHGEEGAIEPHRRESVGDVFPVMRGAPQEDQEGYEPDDPKHPTFHERLSELWDSREK